MSLQYTRWQVLLYNSDTDVSLASYDTLGEVLKTTLDTATIPFVTLNISQTGWQFTPTNEVAQDISGRPYNKKRGWTDGWSIAMTPYYYDSGAYFTVGDSIDIAQAIKKRHLWLFFSGPDSLSTLVASTKAVKVVFESFSETLNNGSASRTAELKFQRKYRADAI